VEECVPSEQVGLKPAASFGLGARRAERSHERQALGILMTPLPASIVAGTLAAAAVFVVILDLLKVPVFRRLGIT
jgi:hypothetical protein